MNNNESGDSSEIRTSNPELPRHWLIGLFALACLLNWVQIPLFSGAELIFGNSIAIVVLLYYGIVPALIISIVSSLMTYFSWGVPINVIPMAIELLVLHWAISKQRNALLLGVLYWATFGWLIVYALAYLAYDLAEFAYRAIVIKYVFNGILAILFGFILARLVAVLTGIQVLQTKRNISQILSYQLFMLAAIISSVVAISGLKLLQNQRLEDIQNYLELKAETTATRIENHVLNHQQALQLAQSHQPNTSNLDELQDLLVNLKSNYPSILTLLATDRDGNILLAAPVSLLDITRNNNITNVSDRPYYSVPRETLKPYISDVFQGRGFGDDAIVALSIPMIKNSKFDGVIEASLNLELFSELDTHLLDTDEGLLVFDKLNRVIYSAGVLGFDFLQSLDNSNVLNWLNSPDDYYTTAASGHSFIGYQNMIDKLGWTVMVSMPRAYYENSIANYMLIVVITLIVTLTLIFYLSSYVTRTMTQPIRALSNSLSEADQPEDLDLTDFDTMNIRELSEVSTRLKEFTERSKAILATLQTTNDEKESINQELKALNDNLESIVSQKTADLNVALKSANEANLAKSDFLANMSHEIRTPMNGILGILDLLGKSDVDKDQQEFLRLAQDSANSLLVIINDILDLSKVESGVLELEEIPFSMYELLDDALAFYRSNHHDDNVQIIFNAKNDKSICSGDPNRIRQIINNLLSNALKFTSQGEIVLTLESSLERDVVSYDISVTDTGIGIPSDKLVDLFDSFTQADTSTTRLYGGTGLGLAICKRLVEMMQGKIRVSSQVDTGSEFTVQLHFPVTDKRLSVKTPSEKIAAISDNTIEVLLVEDNVVNQKVASAMLKKLGFQVQVADNGQLAVELLSENDAIELVFMDCQMPVLDGYATSEAIRAGKAGKGHINTPIIALTANALTGEREKCIAAGMNDFLTKPIDYQNLKNAILSNLAV